MASSGKIHVNKKTGKSGPCNAQEGNCPLGSDAPHFSNQGEADRYIATMEAESNDTFATVSKKGAGQSTPSKAEPRNLRRGQRGVVAGKAVRELPSEITPSTPIDDMIHLAEYKGEQVNVNFQEADGSIHLSRGGDNEEEVLHMRTLRNDSAMATLRYNAEETLYDGSRERATLWGDNGEVMEVRLKPWAGSGGIVMEVESFTPAPHRPKAQQQRIDALRGDVEMLELSRESLWRRTEDNYDTAERLAQEGKYEELEKFYKDVSDPTVQEREMIQEQLDASTARLKGMLGRN